MMVKILDVLGENPDRANLESAVFSIQDFDLGIGELVSFGPDRRQGLQTVYYTIVDAGTLRSLGRLEAQVCLR